MSAFVSGVSGDTNAARPPRSGRQVDDTGSDLSECLASVAGVHRGVVARRGRARSPPAGGAEPFRKGTARGDELESRKYRDPRGSGEGGLDVRGLTSSDFSDENPARHRFTTALHARPDKSCGGDADSEHARCQQRSDLDLPSRQVGTTTMQIWSSTTGVSATVTISNIFCLFNASATTNR